MKHRFVQLTLMALAALILAACGEVATTGVSNVEVTPENPSIAVSETVQLTADVTADPGVDTSVTWSSDAESIAQVSTSGLVTGVANGTANITATSTADTSVSDTVTVTVEAPSVSSVTILEGTSPAPDAVDLPENETRDFDVDVVATGGADTSVTWDSSDTAVATVDENGVVTPAGATGTATITATSDFNAAAFDTVEVTVIDVMFVDASAAAGGDGSQATPFNTIGEALAAVSANGIIEVAPGSYPEALTVNTSVTLNGANAGTSTRGAESTLTGDVTINGAEIDVTFNGFQFQSTSDPGVVSTGTDHSVTYVYNAFNSGFARLRATEPATFRFENNTANITAVAGSGFLNVAGDYDGSTGTSITIADNALTFNRTAPAANLARVSGSISGNQIDMTGVVGGADDTNIGLLLANSTGDLNVNGNTIANANQAIRFEFSLNIDTVAIDTNTFTANRQGIVVSALGSVSNVSVTNNVITGGDESIRAGQAGLSVNDNTFEMAVNAYFVDVSDSYPLAAILNDNGNSFDPAASIGTFDGSNAIVP